MHSIQNETLCRHENSKKNYRVIFDSNLSYVSLVYAQNLSSVKRLHILEKNHLG